MAEIAGGIATFEHDFATGAWTLSGRFWNLLDREGSAPPTFEEVARSIFPDDLLKLQAAVEAARTAGTLQADFRLRLGADVRWLEARGRTVGARRQPRLWGAFYDISQRKALESRLLRLNETLEARIAELGEETRALGVLNRASTAISANLELDSVVQAVTDAAVELSGAAFGAFFYNLVSEKGESYTLYTLSGAPRSAFEKFPMPRNTAVFAPTFRGTATVRSPDILADPRYGKSAPHFGMPKGHLPVRSYLAVPVTARSGEVLGGLFFGHPQPGMFTERAERLVTAIAAQAAVAIDNVRLYQALQRELEGRRQAEEDLRRINETLEQRAGERTRELADTERRFRLLVEGVTDYAIYMLDPVGNVVNWNPGAQRIKGYARQDVLGQHFSRFYTDEDRSLGIPTRALKTAATSGKYETEGWRVRKDGSQFWASVVINAIHDGEGELMGFAKVTRDLTERRAAEEQLRQAQKMESVGQLTGGVAHDFNNLLTVIIGNLDALQRHLREPAADSERLKRSAENAMRGARRAESLTQRLLAFSRQQPLDPRPVDVGRLIAGMSDLLRRTLGEQIAIETALTGGLWQVDVDPNQLEVAILNLAVNARDAMSNGGRLTLETANVFLDHAYAAGQSEVVPGQYVQLAISDSGVGMTREVQAKAFDPFFTTKDVGQGTGLGLSQVYGFVKQSRGHVKIYSEVGHGTTIKIYLPRLHAEQAIESPVEVPAPVRGRANDTILVVEDDEDVRASTTEMLRDLGYTILEAANARDGLQLLDSHPEIRLLFTDVGLPGGMNGRQLADEARRRRSNLKILFASGYARNAIVHDGRLDPGVELITKPFTQDVLAARVRDILDAGATTGRVLVVEDEAMIQMLAVQFLEERGLKADVAGSATDALNKLRLIPGGVDAVVIDLGLPDRPGEFLVREIRSLFPTLPVVLASGAHHRELEKLAREQSRLAIVGKPYTAETLMAALRSLGIHC
ncbi:MAG: response regulator [Rhodospirillales bacterium]|nr:response regulator [Rhodospirillales bacterium]